MKRENLASYLVYRYLRAEDRKKSEKTLDDWKRITRQERYIVLNEARLKGFITNEDVRKMLTCSPQLAYFKLNQLRRHGWLKKDGRGRYIPTNKCFKHLDAYPLEPSKTFKTDLSKIKLQLLRKMDRL